MTEAGSSGAALRLLTFNVRTGLAPERRWSRLWWARRGAAWAVLADLAPDVVALQEAHGFQWRWLARDAGGYSFAGTRPRGRWLGEACPVLVRTDRLAVEAEEVAWYTDGGLRADQPGARMRGAGHPRVAVTVRLTDRVTGRELAVVNTHLDTRRSARSVAARHLAAAVAGPSLPTVVVGDFNAATDAPELAPLASAGYRPAAVDGATFHAYRGRTGGPPIDHVYLSRHWRVLAAYVDRSRPGGRLPSDHWPVVVDAVLADA